MHLDQLEKFTNLLKKPPFSENWVVVLSNIFLNVQPDPSGNDRICQIFFLQRWEGGPTTKNPLAPPGGSATLCCWGRLDWLVGRDFHLFS